MNLPIKYEENLPGLKTGDVLWTKDSEGNFISEPLVMHVTELPSLFGSSMDICQNTNSKNKNDPLQKEIIVGMPQLVDQDKEYLAAVFQYIRGYSLLNHKADDQNLAAVFQSISHYPLLHCKADEQLYAANIFNIKFTPKALGHDGLHLSFENARTESSVKETIDMLNKATGVSWKLRIRTSSTVENHYIVNLPVDIDNVQAQGLALSTLYNKIKSRLTTKLNEIAERAVPDYREEKEKNINTTSYLVAPLATKPVIDFGQKKEILDVNSRVLPFIEPDGYALIIPAEVMENKNFQGEFLKEAENKLSVVNKSLATMAEYQKKFYSGNKRFV